jgi:pimeloyl-ACP methyl ester carboxylesterase
MLELSNAFEAAIDAGEPDAAKRIIDYWGGDGSFDAMPDAAQDYCRATASSNVLDWRSVKTTDINPEDLAQLDIPVLAVRGGLANPAMVAITDALTENLPDVRMATVDGASHFLITTHADDCARLLADFLAEVTA